MSDIQRVPRPTTTKRARRVGTFTDALRQTLTTGDAIAVPLNADTYAVVRNRISGGASSIAHRMNVSVRTQKSDDGLSVLVWLEAKPVQTSEATS